MSSVGIIAIPGIHPQVQREMSLWRKILEESGTPEQADEAVERCRADWWKSPEGEKYRSLYRMGCYW